MMMKRSSAFLGAGVCAGLTAVLFGVGASRIGGDGAGLGLFIAAAALWAVAAFGFLVAWRRERRKEAKEQDEEVNR